MLILTRGPRERLMIGDEIVLQVVEIYRDRVVLGIEAPREIAVHREEVYERIQESRAAKQIRQDEKPRRHTTTRSKGEND